MGDVEDRRTAVGLSVNLSGQLITGALAMIAIEGAYVAYVLGAHTATRFFYVLAVLAKATLGRPLRSPIAGDKPLALGAHGWQQLRARHPLMARVE